MKVRALKKFEGIKDLERNVFPKEGDVWETTEERANFLKEHGVVEFVEEVKVVEMPKEDREKFILDDPYKDFEVEEKSKKTNKKKKSKK